MIRILEIIIDKCEDRGDRGEEKSEWSEPVMLHVVGMSVKGRGAEAHPEFDLEAEKGRRAECTGTGVHADRILDIVGAEVWVSVLVN
ncbi:unnamed protein product [Onchocerca ochengi]|uniref:Uncharacterized protein n=1 Tax=Onchocerca ochengi TaxID=42157 RepID=A0A182DYD6_ONCOC|nr:unnamed protein product [Onchocerca ochengi]